MGHWYAQDGTPTYTVIGSNGKKRDTTLADARKLNLVPSVTTILNLIAKPQLDNWKLNQVLDAVLKYPNMQVVNATKELLQLITTYTLEQLQNLDRYAEVNKIINQWRGMIINQSQKISRDSAMRGTELHDQLEKYYTGAPISADQFEWIMPVVNAVHSINGEGEWIAEKSFSSIMGFGGKVDLHHTNGIIIDFKTKNTDKFDKDLSYIEHAMQLAAYNMGLLLTPRMSAIRSNFEVERHINIYISTIKPGLIQIKEWTTDEIYNAWLMFEHLLSYWKLSNHVA